jgi:adenylate cyclase class 1
VQLKTLLENKKKYLAYNRFRKGIFEELAPRDSDSVLYLLPWMLSVNHPAVPGYIEKMRRPWKVFHIDADRNVLSREPAFKRRFEISSERSLLKYSLSPCWIEGLYTIGSIGSTAQTSRSDCDIWVCVNRSEAGKEALEDLSRKVNLIKDWLDQHVRIPIYFFLSDTEDIRLCRFGIVEGESSGTAQRQVLKEEFYRTASILGGKIPLWWLCGDEGSEPVDYDAFAEEFREGRYAGEYDLIDLGNIETVDRDEYFGAALWQFNKAMTHPLKSIIKMLLLKMLLESPREELLCHRFRRTVLECPDGQFLDPATFTLQAMLEYYRNLPEKTFAVSYTHLTLPTIYSV